MSTRENIKKVSKTVLKVTKIGKVLSIISMVVALVAGIFLSVSAATGSLLEWIHMAQNSEVGSHLVIRESHGIIQTEEQLIHLEDEALTEYFWEAIGDCFAGVIIMIALFLLLHFLAKVFRVFADSETPFVPELVFGLKRVFIMITVLCVFESIFLAIVVGVSLKCLLEIFKYGCELQIESDETL